MNKLTVREIDVNAKRVLVRVDFNVPVDKQTGEITDDTRIRAALPTIQYLIDREAVVALVSHFGRPAGQVVESRRLDRVGRRLGELLGRPVQKLNDCIGPEVEQAVRAARPGTVLLLENVRFHPGEEANDPKFVGDLAAPFDIFVNDAFGAAHRAHASTAGVADLLPAVAGFLMEKEIDMLGRVVANPDHPFAAIVGGAKVSSKIGVLQNLLMSVDKLLIGGGMAATFLKSQGLEVGQSLVEDPALAVAQQLMASAAARELQFLLPVDAVIADAFAADANHRVVPVDRVPADWRILDIGPETVRQFEDALRDCQTVIWNGPMGVFEFPAFAAGTNAIARLLADLPATTIVGGGESVAAVEALGLTDRLTHVSTGGGASLEMLEGRVLPGVAALNDREGAARSGRESAHG